MKKLAQAFEAAKRKARRSARKGRPHIAKGTLAAAARVILVASRKPEEFPAAGILALYRLRWRIERFKRLQSLIGLQGHRAATNALPDPMSWPIFC